MIHDLFYTSDKIYEVGLIFDERKIHSYGFIQDCKFLQNFLHVDSE